MKKLLFLLILSLLTSVTTFAQINNDLELICGESISIQDQIYGGDLDSDFSTLPIYDGFSINIDSDSSVVEFQCDFELLGNNFGYSSGYIILFQNGNWFESYNFYNYDWGAENELPTQIKLEPGEYTFVYGNQSSNSWGGSLQDYTQNYSIQYPSDSFEIEFTLTMYDGTCYKEGCVDSEALNYNSVATSDDGSCNYILQYGYLSCGETIIESDSIYGGFSDSEYTSLHNFRAFSFNIDSDSSVVEFQCDFELLENNYGYSSGYIILFQNGDWFESYNFSIYDWGDDYIDLPSQIVLDPGEYTFVYGLNSNYWGYNLEDYTQNYSPQDTLGSFEIDFTLTMYDGSCFYNGCTDSIALNYNSYANYDNNQCVYSNDLGEVNCGIPYYVSESISDIGYSLINFSVSDTNAFVEINLLVDSGSFFYIEEEIRGEIGLYHNGVKINNFYFNKYQDGSGSCGLPNAIELDLGDYSIVICAGDVDNLPNDIDQLNDIHLPVPFDIEVELTLYSDNCDNPGCTDLMALNYNPNATIDDGSCKNIINYGGIECGYNYFINDTMNVSPPYYSFDDNYDYYNSFSIEVSSDNSIFELDLDYQTVECDYRCYSPILWIYKDANYWTPFSFTSSIDSIHLDAGEYTFIYGFYNYNSYNVNLNSVSSVISPSFTNGIYNLEIAFTLYDGSCEYPGCTDTSALNFNSLATVTDDIACIYPIDLGVLECGTSEHVSSVPETNYSNFSTFELIEDVDVTFTLLTSGSLPHIYLYNNEYQLIHILDSSHDAGILDTIISLNTGIYYLVHSHQTELNISDSYQYDQSDYINFFNNIYSTAWRYFYLTINQQDSSCDVSGCTDSLALNFNVEANIDDGSCDSYHSFGQIECGEDNIYQSDSMVGVIPYWINGYVPPNFIDSQKYSLISFEISESSIIEFEFDWDLILLPNQGYGYITLNAALLKDNEVININHFEIRSDIDTIFKGDIFNPVYLEEGLYSIVVFPNFSSLKWSNLYLGMNVSELLNSINSMTYNSNCQLYSFFLNLKSFDGSCEYVSCSDESAINFLEFVTVSDNSLCDYPTSGMFCGESVSSTTPITNHYGVVHRSENIFEMEFDVETIVRFQNHAFRIFKDNIYNLIFYRNDGNWNNDIDIYDLTLGPGKYLFLKEYGEIGQSLVVDCLGCQDDLACNFNEQANISNTLCNYVENACDYCLGGVMYNSDLNDNNICDTDEVFGCNDSTAINFNSSANVNDLSCEYYPTSQTILLPTGWSMFSIYLEPLNSDLSVVLDMIKENVLIVKNNFGDAFIPDYDYNGIGDVINGSGYQIKINSSVPIVVLNVFGEFLNPLINPINLDAGWNMIGHLRTDNISAVDIFSELNEQGNLILAKNYLGGAYLPEFGFNGLGYFQPGQGYQVKTYESGFLWILPLSQNY